MTISPHLSSLPIRMGASIAMHSEGSGTHRAGRERSFAGLVPLRYPHVSPSDLCNRQSDLTCRSREQPTHQGSMHTGLRGKAHGHPFLMERRECGQYRGRARSRAAMRQRGTSLNIRLLPRLRQHAAPRRGCPSRGCFDGLRTLIRTAAGASRSSSRLRRTATRVMDRMAARGRLA